MRRLWATPGPAREFHRNTVAAPLGRQRKAVKYRSTGRSDGRTGLPVRPAEVPAVEAVVRLDRLVAGVGDDHDVADDRVAVHPVAGRARVVGALGVRETHTAVA